MTNSTALASLAPLAAIRTAPTRAEAVRCFLAVLDDHAEHIQDVKRRAEQIFRFETPDRPWFQFDVSGHTYQKSRWVEAPLDGLLDGGMQGIVFKLETMPESDYVPLLGTGIGTSDLIPSMFGVTFDKTAEGAVLQRFNLLEELPRDLVKLQGVDVTKTEPWRDVMERLSFLVDVTGGKAQIAYPQMQGPDTNAARLMDQAEMLMACMTNPDDMRVVSNTWAEVSASIILEMQRIAGDPGLIRPRGRFYQPPFITGLIVGDYLTVMQPDQFFTVFSEAFDIMYKRVGPLFYHTCGPISHTLKVLGKLPGIRVFECGYVRGQTKLTADLEEAKAFFAGKTVVCSFESTLGGAVDNMENLTAKWLRDMSKGGGYMMQDSGPVEEGRELFRKLELE